MVAGLQILSSEIVVSQGVKFVTLQQGEIPYIGGPLGLLKVNEACHYVEVRKIQEMKNISQP
jgi:hypothetical protein